LGPEELVEFGIDSDIVSLHHLGDQAFDLPDSSGCFLFELYSVNELVNIDGCIDSSLGEPFSFLFLTHYHKIIII
jgi:hypothetical protein